MTSPWRSRMPLDDGSYGGDSHEYAMWDAVYVLGSLSATDRRDFEAHMAGCTSCREAVAELSGMPALLSQLDRDQMAAIQVGVPPACGGGDHAYGAPPLGPEVLTSLLTTVRRRRRRSHLRAWTAAATAAVVLTIGVYAGLQAHFSAAVPAPPQASATSVLAPSQASVPALPMAQVGTNALASTVSLSGQHWGTFIQMKCVCLAPANAARDTLAMVVVGRNGSHTRLATWVAQPGHTATPGASISTPVDQIAAVQVVAADTGDVLLQRSL